MRATVFAAALLILFSSPASAQLEAGPSDRLMDRLSVEGFGGYVPGATDWIWVDLNWSFRSMTSRHRLETVHDGAPLTGVGVRYDVTPGIRITGALAYAPRDDRIVNLHSSDRVKFTVGERDHLKWETVGGGTTLGRLGLEVAGLQTEILDVWVGGGAGLVRATSGLEEEISSEPYDTPSQFLDTWTAPSAFLTGRIEAPLRGPVGLALAADHHWTWWDQDDLEGGVEEFFEAPQFEFKGVTSDGMRAKMWLVRLGLTYQPN